MCVPWIFPIYFGNSLCYDGCKLTAPYAVGTHAPMLMEGDAP